MNISRTRCPRRRGKKTRERPLLADGTEGEEQKEREEAATGKEDRGVLGGGGRPGHALGPRGRDAGPRHARDR